MKVAQPEMKAKLTLEETLTDDLDGDGKPDFIYVVSAEVERQDDAPMSYAGIFVQLAASRRQSIAVRTASMHGENMSFIGTADVAGDGRRELVYHEGWTAATPSPSTASAAAPPRPWPGSGATREGGAILLLAACGGAAKHTEAPTRPEDVPVVRTDKHIESTLPPPEVVQAAKKQPARDSALLVGAGEPARLMALAC